jgi:hypothetical protein
VSVSPSSTPAREYGPTQIVAGFLAASAIFIGCIGIVYTPVRIVPGAILIALLAVCMGPRDQRLGIAAVVITACSFFAGMTVAVLTGHPLW